MRLAPLVPSLLLFFSAGPARAQLAPRSIALEAGLSAPAGGGPGADLPAALAASFWLDGDLDAVFRLAGGSAPRTDGRAADRWWAGTVGLRWSLAPGPVRPQLFAELGWARTAGAGADRAVAGGGAALEWFAVRDVALGAAVAVRQGRAGTGPRVDASLSLALYF